MVVGCLGTGTPRLWDGRYLSSEMRTTLSLISFAGRARKGDLVVIRALPRALWQMLAAHSPGLNLNQ